MVIYAKHLAIDRQHSRNNRHAPNLLELFSHKLLYLVVTSRFRVLSAVVNTTVDTS
jgi:hypothetical protein